MTYCTAIDLVMGYYSMKLDESVKKYCVIVLPWGKYVYNCLPMGLKISSDVFQRELGNLFSDCPFVLVYIDDILILSKGSYENHLEQIEIVLERLLKKGMQVHAIKSIFAAAETEYLGYMLTREGVKPQASKIKAILNIAVPETVRQLRGFVGIVNFYRDMWPKRAETMKPLTDLINKKREKYSGQKRPKRPS